MKTSDNIKKSVLDTFTDPLRKSLPKSDSDFSWDMIIKNKNLISNAINLSRMTKDKYKQRDILDCVWNCLEHVELLPYIFIKIQKYMKENIFKFDGGDIFGKLRIHLIDSGNIEFIDNINKIINFYECLSTKTPSGLDTSPTARCGKFELLYLIIVPNSTSPKKGDILDNGQLIELKGNQVRLLSLSVSGKDYKKDMSKLSNVFNYPQHKSTIKNYTESFEPEKKKNKEIFKSLFNKNIPKSKKFHKEWFLVIGLSLSDEENEQIHRNNKWHFFYTRKLITSKFAKQMWDYEKFNELWLCGNGKNITIFKSYSDLKENILNGSIKITADYFRINQTAKIGFYIEIFSEDN